MKIRVGINTSVFGGYDAAGNPFHHVVDADVSDKVQTGESEEHAVIRVSHTALDALLHSILHLVGGQSEDIRTEALKQIGVMQVEVDEDGNPQMPDLDISNLDLNFDLSDDSGGGSSHISYDWNDLIRKTPIDSDIVNLTNNGYGWNDGLPEADDEGGGAPGSAEARGTTDDPDDFIPPDKPFNPDDIPF